MGIPRRRAKLAAQLRLRLQGPHRGCIALGDEILAFARPGHVQVLPTLAGEILGLLPCVHFVDMEARTLSEIMDWVVEQNHAGSC